MNWLHRLLHPHCEQCREDDREKKINEPYEALKLENARLTEMIDRLFDRLLEKPEPIIEEPKPASTVKPAHIPWRVRQQMLEEQDRDTARKLREAPKPDPKVAEDIKNLEVELGVEEKPEEEKVS